jgi:hypothetical protein
MTDYSEGIVGFGASGRNGGWCSSKFPVTPGMLKPREVCAARIPANRLSCGKPTAHVPRTPEQASSSENTEPIVISLAWDSEDKYLLHQGTLERLLPPHSMTWARHAIGTCEDKCQIAS